MDYFCGVYRSPSPVGLERGLGGEVRPRSQAVKVVQFVDLDGRRGTGIVRGPGLIHVDFSVLRNFRITERIHTEFRGEFFNGVNRTNFGNPGTAFGSSGFGVVSSAGPARQIQLGARILF